MTFGGFTAARGGVLTLVDSSCLKSLLHLNKCQGVTLVIMVMVWCWCVLFLLLVGVAY